MIDFTVNNAFAPSGSILGFKSAVDSSAREELAGVFLNNTAGPQNLNNSSSFGNMLGAVKITDSLGLIGATSTVGGDGLAGSMVNTLTFEQVPEPFTMALSGAGLLGLGLLRRRTKKA